MKLVSKTIATTERLAGKGKYGFQVLADARLFGQNTRDCLKRYSQAFHSSDRAIKSLRFTLKSHSYNLIAGKFTLASRDLDDDGERKARRSIICMRICVSLQDSLKTSKSSAEAIGSRTIHQFIEEIGQLIAPTGHPSGLHGRYYKHRASGKLAVQL